MTEEKEMQIRTYLTLLGNITSMYDTVQKIEEVFPEVENATSFALRCYKEGCFSWSGYYYDQIDKTRIKLL